MARESPVPTVAKRRAFLKSAGAATVVGLAGCTGDGGNGGGGSSGGGGGDGDGGSDNGGSDGNGGSTGGGSGSVELNLMIGGGNPATQDAFTSAFDNWADSIDQDVTRSMSFPGDTAMQNQLNTQMATGDTQDLYFGNGQNLIRFHQQLADHSPITDELSSLPDDLLVVLEGGKVPTVPTSLVPSFQYHRVDVLEDAGLSIPTTWEENLQVHVDLAEHLEGQSMNNMVLATNPEVFSSMWYHQSDLKSNQGKWFERDSDGVIQVVIDEDPYYDRALEFLQYYRDWGQVAETGPTWGWTDKLESYANEQVAIQRYSPRLLNSLHERDVDFIEDTEINMFPLEDRPDRIFNMSSNSFAVPDNEHKDLVFDFVRFFMTSDAFITYLHAVPFHFTPANRDMLKNPAYEENPIVSQHLDFRDLIFDEHPNFRTVPQYQNPPFVGWFEILATRQVASNMIANTIEGRRTPKQSLDTAIQELNGLIGEYQDS